MDQQIEIKEEPVWLQGSANTSFASADIKDETIIEEQTVEQLVPCFKEENKSHTGPRCCAFNHHSRSETCAVSDTDNATPHNVSCPSTHYVQ
ncbi:uncharacterized protein [Anabrus simplex]|uniref:uncharacterized protein isoform X2 n=1 Tax=Anabrus simplex TaxID=316456 RepID=UPI0035A2DAE3